MGNVKPTILVIDDEPEIRRLVREILEDEDYVVEVAKDGGSAREAVAQHAPDLILLDIWMPDIDGISLLKEFVEDLGIRCPVIMMSGHGTVEAAVEATRLGAQNFIEKPLSLSKLLLTVESALSDTSNMVSTATVRRRPPSKIEPVELVGRSAVVLNLKKSLQLCALHDVTVLLQGELGTGKSHCARYIHSHGPRRASPFVIFRTATLRQSQRGNMLEPLLGRQQGGRILPGFLQQAAGGTLYIDDIAELDPDTQAALYGVVSSQVFYPLGASEPVLATARIIAASHANLEQMMLQRRLRQDLFHCINGFPFTLPPLRMHSEDVPELLQYFVNSFADRDGLPYRSFSVAAQNRLRNYQWPGNILELENMVRRLLIQGGESSIGLAEIEQAVSQGPILPEAAVLAPVMETLDVFALPLRQAREQFERAYLEYHLKQANGSVGKVAKRSGLERTHLYRKLRALNIEPKLGSPSVKDN